MLSADYIAGLVDGEGCFYVNIRPPDKRWPQAKPSVETHFYLKMKKEEWVLLQMVKKFFGCGAVYYQKEKRSNHTACYRYEINSQRDIQGVLIPFFDRHPLKSSKRKDYSIFRKIALIIESKKHKTPSGLKQILQLKS